MSRAKSIADLMAARSVLNSSVRLFHEGQIHMYRVVAVELRKLLCDGKNSLVPRLFSAARLHPIRGYMSSEERAAYKRRFGRDPWEGLAFRMPAVVSFDGEGGARVTEIVDKSKQPITIDEWIAQPLFNAQITVREFIRSVADKEGAHSDRSYNETLLLGKHVSLAEQELHPPTMIALAEYIASVLDVAIAQIPSHLLPRGRKAI